MNEMKTNGQLYKCDRCGMTHFVKLLKTGPYCYNQYKYLLRQYKSQKITHFSFECCGNCNECQKENCVNRLDGEDG